MEILRPRLPNVKLWIEVGDGANLPADTYDYENLATSGKGENLDVAREGGDLLFLYTGGTTGMPKGVMWEHDALRETQTMALRALGDVPETLDELKAHLQTNGPGEVYIPACPLMHGTGLFTAMAAMMNGGTIVTLEAASLDCMNYGKRWNAAVCKISRLSAMPLPSPCWRHWKKMRVLMTYRALSA